MSRTLAERFWPKVASGGPDECWPWTAHCHVSGYGRFGIGSRTLGTKRMHHAHRVAWALTIGPVPDGAHVLHRCDNPPCCNPAHLFLGTHEDNMRDMVEKGRRRGPVLRGERNGRHRLTESAVRAIRAMRARGLLLEEIAALHSVDMTTIHLVVTRRTWKHVSEGSPNE